MKLLSPRCSSFLSFTPNIHRHTCNKTSSRTTLKTSNKVSIRSLSSPPRRIDSTESTQTTVDSVSCSGGRFCLCGRRQFIEAAAVGTSLLPIPASKGSDLHSDDPITMLNRIRPPRPDWYEEFYASVINIAMKPYEDEIAGYKSQLFANLSAKANKILEIGVGTGPNLKYYASNSSVHVFGIDPNRKMEKYAQATAGAVGLPPTNFEFIHAVAEALPLSDSSVDAVVGTLVLCSVKDVDMALQEVRRVLKPGGLYLFVEHVAAKDGTIHKFVQDVLNPLQQTLSDGCHLTRKTGKNISEAGFSGVDINMVSVSIATFVNPHVYGVARK